MPRLFFLLFHSSETRGFWSFGFGNPAKNKHNEE